MDLFKQVFCLEIKKKVKIKLMQFILRNRINIGNVVLTAGKFQVNVISFTGS